MLKIEFKHKLQNLNMRLALCGFIRILLKKKVNSFKKKLKIILVVSFLSYCIVGKYQYIFLIKFCNLCLNFNFLINSTIY